MYIKYMTSLLPLFCIRAYATTCRLFFVLNTSFQPAKSDVDTNPGSLWSLPYAKPTY